MEFGAENVGDKAISKQYYFNANGFCISNIIREKKSTQGLEKVFSNHVCAKKLYWEHRLKIRENNVGKRQRG